jgi:hypothetical protein
LVNEILRVVYMIFYIVSSNLFFSFYANTFHKEYLVLTVYFSFILFFHTFLRQHKLVIVPTPNYYPKEHFLSAVNVVFLELVGSHFGSYVHSLFLHFCKSLFPEHEPMTSWSQDNSFTATPGLPVVFLELAIGRNYLEAKNSGEGSCATVQEKLSAR